MPDQTKTEGIPTKNHHSGLEKHSAVKVALNAVHAYLKPFQIEASISRSRIAELVFGDVFACDKVDAALIADAILAGPPYRFEWLEVGGSDRDVQIAAQRIFIEMVVCQLPNKDGSVHPWQNEPDGQPFDHEFVGELVSTLVNHSVENGLPIPTALLLNEKDLKEYNDSFESLGRLIVAGNPPVQNIAYARRHVGPKSIFIKKDDRVAPGTYQVEFPSLSLEERMKQISQALDAGSTPALDEALESGSHPKVDQKFIDNFIAEMTIAFPFKDLVELTTQLAKRVNKMTSIPLPTASTSSRKRKPTKRS